MYLTPHLSASLGKCYFITEEAVFPGINHFANVLACGQKNLQRGFFGVLSCLSSHSAFRERCFPRCRPPVRSCRAALPVPPPSQLIACGSCLFHSPIAARKLWAEAKFVYIRAGSFRNPEREELRSSVEESFPPLPLQELCVAHTQPWHREGLIDFPRNLDIRPSLFAAS